MVLDSRPGGLKSSEKLGQRGPAWLWGGGLPPWQPGEVVGVGGGGIQEPGLRRQHDGAQSRSRPPGTLTFVLWGEALHGQRQRLVEPLLPGDEGLAHGVLIVLHHAQVSPDLVQEGL